MNYPYLLRPLPDSSIEGSPIEASGRTRSRDRGKLDRGIGQGRLTPLLCLDQVMKRNFSESSAWQTHETQLTYIHPSSVTGTRCDSVAFPML
jgi:hypothetical protein